MKIGIVSDSHGNDRVLAAAVQMLEGRGVEAIVHCGDIGTTDSIRVLASARAPVYAVAGNTDRHTAAFEDACLAGDVHFGWQVIVVPLDGDRKLAAIHGNDEQVLGEMILSQQFVYVCHGHSHRVRDERVGKTRVINPGALFRAARRTVAILDTQADTVEVLDVPERADSVPQRPSHASVAR